MTRVEAKRTRSCATRRLCCADWRPTCSGVPVPVLAARFHEAVARMIVQLAGRTRERTGISVVALSGGVFQNVSLLERSAARLRGEGFEVLVHRRVPANDGGLAVSGRRPWPWHGHKPRFNQGRRDESGTRTRWIAR